jgi:MFS family permease
MRHIARSIRLRSPVDRYGSRDTLRVVDAACYLGAGRRSCVNFLFIVCRFFAGIAIGGSSVLAPVYFAQISPAQRRGVFVGLFQAFPVIAAH